MADAAAMIVVAPEAPPARVWGTGGWLPPESREALDWVTLARWMGLAVEVVAAGRAADGRGLARGAKWIVLAGAPEDFPAGVIERLRGRLAAERVVVIGRAGSAGLPWSDLAGAAATGDATAGGILRCRGDEAREWRCRKPFAAKGLTLGPDVAVLAAADGRPVVVVRAVGRGSAVSLAFHPSEARDADGAATALLRQVLIETSLAPLAWIDLERTVALRMDDPGAAQNVHLRTWRYRQLDGDAWQRIGAALDARAARLSVAYVCGWVDDGDPARGSLEVRGRPARRTPGRVHRSADVVYREVAGDAPARVHDYRGQFAALRSLRRQGSVDVELHGYTHMHPDRSRWARAADRYDAVDWYRELGAAAQRSLVGTAPEAHPLALGAGCIERSFGAAPSTLVCPGDQWTDEALGVALDLGLRAVSSYYFALRHDDRFCWCQHVCAPYLDEVDAAWLDSPLPLVGYFHDRDVALHGVGWLERALDRWREAGARRFVTLRDLALASGATLDIGGDGVLELRCAGPVASAGSLPVRVRIPGTPRPQRIAFRRAAAPGQRSDEALPLTAAGDGVFGLPLADGARRGGRGPMTVSKR